ncbi:MAG: hypothetical protein AB1422_01605 [bacterium]
MKHKGLAQQLSGRKDKWRSKKGRKRLIKTYLKKFIKLSILILVIVILWQIIQLPFFLMSSHKFQVKKPIIILENKGIIEEEEIFKTFKEFCLKNYSSVEPSIFKIKFTDLKNTLLKNPKIEYIVIQRKFPKDIVIKIKPRKPVAKILIGSRVFGIDKNLIAFKMENEQELPVITGIRTLKTGIPLTNKELTDALLVISQIKEHEIELLPDLLCIDIAHQYDILLITKFDETKIHLGHQLEPKRLVERLKELKIILDYYREKSEYPEYIDLRFDNIIVKDREKI